MYRQIYLDESPNEQNYTHSKSVRTTGFQCWIVLNVLLIIFQTCPFYVKYKVIVRQFCKGVLCVGYLTIPQSSTNYIWSHKVCDAKAYFFTVAFIIVSENLIKCIYYMLFDVRTTGPRRGTPIQLYTCNQIKSIQQYVDTMLSSSGL